MPCRGLAGERLLRSLGLRFHGGGGNLDGLLTRRRLRSLHGGRFVDGDIRLGLRRCAFVVGSCAVRNGTPPMKAYKAFG